MIPLRKNNIDEKEEISLNNTKDNNNNTKGLSEIKTANDCKKLNSKNFEGVIEFLFLKFSGAVKIIGPLFAFCLVMFVIVVSYTVFGFIIPYWMKHINHIIGVLLFFLAIYLLLSILFNYFLAVLVKPGSLKDLRNSKYYRKNDPLNFMKSEINFESSKLAENLRFFNEKENERVNNIKKTENMENRIKLRFKADEYNNNMNSNLTISNTVENTNVFVKYDQQEDIKALSNIERNNQQNGDNTFNEESKINYQ